MGISYNELGFIISQGKCLIGRTDDEAMLSLSSIFGR
jgi:hypothetical protein